MTDHAPAVVCTLTTKALAERSLEWSDLRGLALHREQIANGAASTYPLDNAAEIEDLASRELDCCGSWLTITTIRGDDHLRLELTTENPEGIGVIRAMSGLGGATNS